MSLTFIEKRMVCLSVIVAGLIVASGGVIHANPTGGVVAAGSASINSAPGALTINQASNTAIINWQTFSINSGELTKFIQPSATSAVLNRVLGGQTSIINGTLSANGQVYLINGNGILVSATGLINTNGFLASTRDISDSDFLSGNFHFTGDNSAGVQNLGKINALGGDVILIGKTVDNEGAINAPNGTVGLAAGDDVLIAQSGNQHVFVNPTSTAGVAAGQTAVTNNGAISAANAELRAANGNMYALAINNAGTIRATTITQQGGDIYLTSDDNTVENSGVLNASATARGGQGGQVTLKTAGAAVHTGKIIAQGGAGGIGGNVDISGSNLGFTGSVDLTAAGGQTGDLLLDPATLNVVTSGTGTISGGQNDSTSTSIDPSTVDTALGTANLTLNANTNITISNAISWTSKNTLSLTTNTSGSTIDINAAITGTNGGLSITTAGAGDAILPNAAVNVSTFVLAKGTWKQIAGANGISSTLPAFSAPMDFELTGTQSTFERFAGGTGAAATPYQITDIYGLQGLASPSNFFYAGLLNSNNKYSFILNNNIDATVTKNWRGGTGFAPIGALGKPAGIVGTFNGNNFVISNLYEHYNGSGSYTNDNGDVGLFSYTRSNSTTTSVIENLGLTNVDFSATNDASGYVGGLVDDNTVTLTNDYVTGKITGEAGVSLGGLVAFNNGGKISQSYSTATINVTINTTGSAVGGLVGENEGSIKTSYATGSVTVTSQTAASGASGNVGIGGFCGYEGSSGTITDSYATGAVTVSGIDQDEVNDASVSVGGFIGEMDDGGQITDVYSIGDVVATNYGLDFVGYFAGDIESAGVTEAYARTDNQTTADISLVENGDSDNVTGLTGGVILTSSKIALLNETGTWYQATSATGATEGFPTLTAPAASDSTTTSLSGPSSATYGGTITLTATVLDTTNSSSIPTGTVSFDEDASGNLTVIGTGTLALNGSNDQASIALSGATSLDAGSYSLVAVYGGATGFLTSNSEASPLALTVGQKALIVTAGTATKTYGSTMLTFSGGTQYTTSGLVNGTSDMVTGVTFGGPGYAATAGVNGGTAYALTASAATGSGLSNYSITYAPGTVTVNPAVLTYTANAAMSTYGSSLPSLSGTVTGFVNSDTLGSATTGTLSFTTTATSASNAGTYAINGSGLSAANYTFQQAAGNSTALTINPATLTITVKPATKTYGSTTPTFAGTPFTTSGLENNNTVTSLTYGGSGLAATAGVSGSPYSLTASNAQGGAGFSAANYSITYNPSTLTVTPASLTLAASNQNVPIGGEVNLTPTLNSTYTVSGLQNNDQLTGVLATGPSLSSTQSTAAAGTFNNAIVIAATLNGSLGANYNLNLENGTLTVANPDQTPLINTYSNQQQLSQYSNTDGNANYNTLFAQSNFTPGGNSGNTIQVPTGSGEPPVSFDQSSGGNTEGSGNTSGDGQDFGHASSYTVGNQ